VAIRKGMYMPVFRNSLVFYSTLCSSLIKKALEDSSATWCQTLNLMLRSFIPCVTANFESACKYNLVSKISCVKNLMFVLSLKK